MPMSSASAFEDMFACSPASLVKLRAHERAETSDASPRRELAFSDRELDARYGARSSPEVVSAFADMFACSPSSLKKMRQTSAATGRGANGERWSAEAVAATPRDGAASRENLASAFGDMFLASPASLKKMQTVSSAEGEKGGAFSWGRQLGSPVLSCEAPKEVVSFSEMFASSPADLAKMRRSDVGGSERGSSVGVPKVTANVYEHASAFSSMFASSPSDLAKMRGKRTSSISYADGAHVTENRFHVVAPDFKAMFTSSPSDLKNLRTASTSRKSLGVEHDRFEVTYLLVAPSEASAREKVLEVCLEQTVELPATLVPEGTWIREHVVGRLESLSHPKSGPHSKRTDAWNAVVSYHADTTGGELTQLVNVIFGNTSMKENVMVVDFELPESMLREYPGPRFGVEGIRRLLRVPEGPLVMTALKPMGLNSQELAEIAYGFAKGGIDIIKDDHGLADQPYSPYDERIRVCSEAVARANAETGRNVIYAPCINAPAHLIISRAHAARRAGAGAVLMIPGITGLDAMRELAADSSFNLPIIAHPALLGCMLGGGSANRIAGFSHEVLLGLLPRLAGADATVFPSFGGRFGFSVEECQAINTGCTRPMGNLPAILPSPGGGMTLEKIAQMREVYGPDLLLLIGGSLYSHSDNLIEGARHFMKLAGRKELYGPFERPHDGHRDHRT